MENDDMFIRIKILINLNIFARYPKIFHNYIKKYENSKQIKIYIDKLIKDQKNITEFEKSISYFIANKDLNEHNKKIYRILTFDIKQSVIDAVQTSEMYVIQTKKNINLTTPINRRNTI